MNSRDSVITRLATGGGGAVHAELLAALRAAGSRPMLVNKGRTYSGDTLARMLTGATEGLAAVGVTAGDVVVLAVRPGTELLLAIPALLRLGAVATPFDRGAGPELFAQRLRTLETRWVIGESVIYAASSGPLRWALGRAGLELPELNRVAARHVLVGPRLPGCPPDALRWKRIVGGTEGGARAPLAELPVPSPSAPAMIVFTSGTTGAPKGVRHSGSSAANTVALILEHLEVGEGSVFYNHNVHSIVATILAGAATVVSPMRFEPRRWLADVERHRVTDTFLRPWDAHRLAIHVATARGSLPASLRNVYLYSAPVTPALLHRLHAIAPPGLRFVSAYGMTEALPVAWVDSRDRLSWTGNGDLVGHPAPGVDVRVGSAGTLEVRGPNVHSGYLGEERTEWHDTGDLARLDPSGIVLMGRAKDMIIRDSFNIYPGLYEPTIERIAGIGACAMVGVPDAESGNERVHLFVEPQASMPAVEQPAFLSRVERALRVGDSRIDRAALPDQVVMVEDMPRNSRDKIDREELRRRAAGRPAGSAPATADRFCVVVPLYNEEKRVGATLDALAAQTRTDFTLVLVDNGSTDGTRAIIDAWLARHPGVKASVLDEPEKGTGSAADTGFRYAIDRGAEIVFRTDADCIPRPTWFEELCEYVVSRRLDAAGGKLIIRTDDVSLSWLELLPSRIAIPLIPWVARLRRSNRGDGYLIRYMLLPGPNVAIRSSAYLACGGYARKPFDHAHLDKDIANALRRVTPRIGYARRAVVLYSERRTEAYGVIGTIRWLLYRGGRVGPADVR